MSPSTLDNFICGPVIKNDHVLSSLLRHADQRTDSIFYIPNIAGRKLEHINLTCTSKLGYSQGDFLQGGPDFVFSITDPKLIPQILERQVSYTTSVRLPGFDPKSIFLMEFQTTMIAKQGSFMDLMCLCVPLTYTVRAEIEVLASVWVEPQESIIQHGKEVLAQIKLRHNEIFTHSEFVIEDKGLNSVYTTSDRTDELITRREKDVLALVSKGLSTKEIGDVLSISSHTAESHRKKLLEKFAAKNAAELVKKASKVFWLE